MSSLEQAATAEASGPAERLALSPSLRGSEYADLSRRVRQAGLLDRRPAYYLVKIAATTAMLAAGWAAFFLVGDSWWQVAVAACLALAFTQVAFLGHDAGHRQVLRTRRANGLLGLALGNVLIGLSFGWWVGKHNRHHSHPNELDVDPDITIGAIAFTAEQASSKRGFTRLMVRYKAYLFFPMLLLEAVHLHAASFRAVVRGTVRLHSLEALPPRREPRRPVCYARIARPQRGRPALAVVAGMYSVRTPPVSRHGSSARCIALRRPSDP